MFSCVAAAAGFLGAWALILAWHAKFGEMPMLPADGLAYAALAVYGVALTGRCAKKWHAALQRVAVLMACAALAGIDVGITGLQGEIAQERFFAALLGVALVVLAARHAPPGLRKRWLGPGSD